jgi:hypothetical protein
VQRVDDQILAYPGERGKFSNVALTVTMPPDAGSNRTQTMSDMALLIIEEELLTDRLFKKTVLTCSW